MSFVMFYSIRAFRQGMIASKREEDRIDKIRWERAEDLIQKLAREPERPRVRQWASRLMFAVVGMALGVWPFVLIGWSLARWPGVAGAVVVSLPLAAFAVHSMGEFDRRVRRAREQLQRDRSRP